MLRPRTFWAPPPARASVQRYLGMMWLAKLLYPDATAQYNMYNDAHEYYELFYTPDLLKKIMGPNPVKLEEELLPYVKSGGYIYIAIPGMRKDCHDCLPEELLLSWTPQQLEYMHDTAYWSGLIGKCKGAEILSIAEMESNEEVWADWLRQDNEYAVGDRKAMEAGGGKYLNFIAIVLRKK